MSGNLQTRLRAPAVTITFWLALSLFLLPAGVHAQSDMPTATGTILGQVLISRKLASKRMRFRLYPGFKPLPPPTGVEGIDDERANVVIYLKSVPLTAVAPASGDAPQIKQVGETFVPHVLPIVQGTTVDFPNQDPIFHNVFSLSGTKSFDLGRYPKGDSRSVTFEQTGIVPVFCHLHSNMSAIVLVLDNSFFSTPNAEGRYRIEGIPAGTYTVVGWHERSEPVEQQVEVLAGQVVELNIVIPIADDEPSAP